MPTRFPCTRRCARGCAHVPMHTCSMHAQVCTCTCTHAPVLTHVCTRGCTRVSVHAQVCTRVSVHAQVRSDTQVCTRAPVHTDLLPQVRSHPLCTPGCAQSTCAHTRTKLQAPAHTFARSQQRAQHQQPPRRGGEHRVAPPGVTPSLAPTVPPRGVGGTPGLAHPAEMPEWGRLRWGVPTQHPKSHRRVTGAPNLRGCNGCRGVLHSWGGDTRGVPRGSGKSQGVLPGGEHNVGVTGGS